MSTDFSSDNTAFTCPECGSSYFSLLPGGVRQCNGQSSGGPGRCGWRSDGKSKRQLEREKIEASRAAGRMSDATYQWRTGRLKHGEGNPDRPANCKSRLRRACRLFKEGKIDRADFERRIAADLPWFPEWRADLEQEFQITLP